MFCERRLTDSWPMFATADRYIPPLPGAAAPASAAEPRVVPTADQVAEVIAGFSTIGAACRALRAAGWRSTIAGNRITVCDQIFVRYITLAADRDRGNPASWVVYGSADVPAVRVFVAGCR